LTEYHQQSNIEEQKYHFKKGKEYATQNNLLKLLFALFILTLCLAIYSIYSRIVINRKKREIRSNK
jgi:hypothetical protein